MAHSPRVLAEIQRLMRDPDALRSERRVSVRRFDPQQPRVPAGHPHGGRWIDISHPQGSPHSNRAAIVQAALASWRLVQAGTIPSTGQGLGAASVPTLPFGGLLGAISTNETLTSQHGFYETLRDIRTNPQKKGRPFYAGRYVFLSTGPIDERKFPGGFEVRVTSTTYGFDPGTEAYVTIRASPDKPVTIHELDFVVTIK